MEPKRPKILFVCMGNICRSPAAEGVMRALVAKAGEAEAWTIGSAGTIGLHQGELPDARMRAAAARRGYALRSRARQFTAEDFLAWDMILTMDEENRRNVIRLAQTEAERAKVRAFGEFCVKHPTLEVPDPYYGGAQGFEQVLDLLEDGCSQILSAHRDV